MSDESRNKRIEDKIDVISSDITEMKVTQAAQLEVQKAQHESLQYHIKRTDTLEEVVKPVIEFMAMTKGALKLISVIALGAGIIEGTVALLEYLNHAK